MEALTLSSLGIVHKVGCCYLKWSLAADCHLCEVRKLSWQVQCGCQVARRTQTWVWLRDRILGRYGREETKRERDCVCESRGLWVLFVCLCSCTEYMNAVQCMCVCECCLRYRMGSYSCEMPGLRHVGPLRQLRGVLKPDLHCKDCEGGGDRAKWGNDPDWVDLRG
ncbi:hypothetical protein IE53DRAFT_245819 [Violaceomyces palustris]|uniref:Uncharacterized protein n=1 Tax=Violaceomyces palustris TaxID=1673888 RepID=A0ACD0NP31_9BASI|nr:hypothetical protein IE53DRAFT_245819 [Violaceomyces palustris]